MRRMRQSIAEEASLPIPPVAPERFHCTPYHAVIQQLKQQKHELLSSQREERRRARTSGEHQRCRAVESFLRGIVLYPERLVRQANGSAKQILGFGGRRPGGMSRRKFGSELGLLLRRRLCEIRRRGGRQLRDKIRFRQLCKLSIRHPHARNGPLDITVTSVRAPDGEVFGRGLPY